MWPRVQLCRVRTRAAAVSSWVAGGGASDSWMKVRASCAHGDPARFVQAPVLVSHPCTTIPSGDCWWAFCMSRRSSWMYAPGSRFSPVPVIRWSVSLSALYKLHVGRWCAARRMLSCSGSLSRSMGSWFAGVSRPLGSDSGGGLGASAGVDTWEWVSIAVLDVPLDTDSGASCVWSSGARGCVASVANGAVCGSGLGALSRSSSCCASC